MLSLGIQNIEDEFPLEEAQNYFREQAKSHFSVRNKDEEMIPFSPGDIIPLWNLAVPSLENNLACYDILFNGLYNYQAICPEIRSGTMVASKVKVYQKLVIVKDIENKRLSQYILSLIPSKGYETKYKSDILQNFTTCGDKTGFTGLAVYSCLYTRQIARVDTYEDGKRIHGVFLLDATNSTEYREKAEEINKLLSSLTLKKSCSISTRGEYDIDGGWLDIDVVITPETPIDDTDEDDKWLERMHPDDNVDPQPDYDQYIHEEEDYIPDYELEKPNVPSMVGFTLEEQNKLLQVVKKLTELQPNINFKNLKIQKGTRNFGYASIDEKGIIYLYNRFFEAPEKDRAAIIYHEIYHHQKKHYLDEIIISDIHAIKNDPPEGLKQRIIEDIRRDLPHANDDMIEAIYREENIIVEKIRNINFYKNELEAYAAEKSIFPDDKVSESYRLHRDTATWNYEERLKILNNNH